MSWPFSNVNQPNLDTTPGQALPLGSTAVFTGSLWLLGAHFSNTGAVERIVTVTDTAGKVICQVTIAGGGEPSPYEWPFRPVIGVKWFANGAGCVGQIWGYQ